MSPDTADESYYGASSGLSPADIYYATLNGEDLPGSQSQKGSTGKDTVDVGPPMPHTHPEGEKGDNLDKKEYDFPDHCSFAFLGLDLQDEEEDENERLSSCPSSHRLSKGSRSVVNSLAGSRTSRSATTTNNTVRSSLSGESATAISMDEVKERVYSRLPSDIRDMVPKNQWEKLFQSPEAKRTKENEGRRKAPLPPSVFQIKQGAKNERNEEDGDNSVVSDISDFDVPLMDESGRSKDSAYSSGGASNPDAWSTMSIDTSSSTGTLSILEHSTRTRESQELKASNEDKQRTPVLGGPKNVQFGRVQVRLYERVLDINPAVSNGASIAIGWRFRRGGVMTVDEWQVQRGSARCGNELVMPRHVREQILKEWGYKQKDIAGATRNILRAKQDRLVTFQNLHNQGMEEVLEKAARRVKGIMKLGMNSRRNK